IGVSQGQTLQNFKNWRWWANRRRYRLRPIWGARNSSGISMASSRKLVDQGLRFLQIGCVETLGEPAVDGSEEIAGFGVAALVAAEPGEARGRAQFPELGLLFLGDAQGSAI